MAILAETEKDAVISSSGVYRYYLTRTWEKPRWDQMVFCMLNPSTADGKEDDPTIRRCMGFAKREGKTGIIIINLYALRTPDPRDLRGHPDPWGPDNKRYWESGIRAASQVVLAWGNVEWGTRAYQFMELLSNWRTKALCLGKTKKGNPRHPLYLKSDQPFYDFYGGEKYTFTRSE